jgi:nucleoside 2-deoxyribosyltransferase
MADHLDGVKCYLSGPIEFASDCFWRAEPIHILKEKFGLEVFNPFADEKQQWTHDIKTARESDNVEELVRIAKSFVRKDLGMVDRSDFLIAYIPFGIKSVGTVHEIVNSNNSKKPTLLVTDQQTITQLPLWYFGFINVRYMFAGWNSLYKYLDKVNNGEEKEDDRWHLVYGIV